VPCGRLGSEEDVAEAVAYVACEAAAYTTGQVLGIDGGVV
jgi:NAD(P)-dependent dehydrogenase (short-subunit alcohol dehydrogenase family)